MSKRMSTFETDKINSLKQVITESLRVQLGGAEHVEYIDVANKLTEVTSRNNHVIFGRRGTGKTLLLHSIDKNVATAFKVIYINCEDYKNHSFPNVLIEILDAIFSQMENELTSWFGRQKQLKTILGKVRGELKQYKADPDSLAQSIKLTTDSSVKADAQAGKPGVLKAGASASERNKIEREYQTNDEKIVKLNLLLPKIKAHVRDVFEATEKVSAIFIELDDFYQLKRADQPFIIDFVHRLCKDVPLYFKVGTLRHVSALYVSKLGQPFGAQERHDFQPVDIDFTLTQLDKTTSLLRGIIEEMGRQVGWTADDLTAIFKGKGFARLVLASGGVPRDFLSFLLSFSLQPKSIGADEVRKLCKQAIEERIHDLKSDSRQNEQAGLLRGIYAIREFCSVSKTNVFLISEQELNKSDDAKELVNRLLDYRIIHSVGLSLTRKRGTDTFQAFMIDLGVYAHLRKLAGRFKEYEISDREDMRNAPVLSVAKLTETLASVGDQTEEQLERELIPNEDQG